MSSTRDRVRELLATGATNKMIARQVDRSARTVQVHVSLILAELRVANRRQAAVALRQQG